MPRIIIIPTVIWMKLMLSPRNKKANITPNIVEVEKITPVFDTPISRNARRKRTNENPIPNAPTTNRYGRDRRVIPQPIPNGKEESSRMLPPNEHLIAVS